MRWRWPGLPGLGTVYAAVPLIVAARTAAQPITDNSFLWHIRAGDAQVVAGEVLRRDPFSYTRFGEPWRTQSWLADLLYSVLHERFGLGFVPWMILMVGVLLWMAIGITIHRETRAAIPTAVAGSAVMVLVGFYLVPRPVLFSLLLLALLMLVLRDGRAAWTAPLLVWVWAAVHGSWIIGVGLLLLAALSRGGRLPAARAVAASTASLLTAHGLGVVWVLLDFAASRDTVNMMAEWRPPDFTSPVNLIFVAMIAAVLLAATSAAVTPRELLIIIPLIAFGMTSQRAVVAASVALAGFAARALARFRWEPKRGIGVLNALILGTLVTVTVGLAATGGTLDRERFPVVAAAFVPDVERSVHDDPTGGYLIYARWPEQKVFIDDRAELYGTLLNEWTGVRSGDTPPEPFLRRIGATVALLRSTDPLVWILRDSGWRVTFSDQHWTVLEHP